MGQSPLLDASKSFRANERNGLGVVYKVHLYNAWNQFHLTFNAHLFMIHIWHT